MRGGRKLDPGEAAIMTLVFNREGKGPGTHALIVASGDVPFPLARQLARERETATDAAFHSALALVNWLLCKFRHPGAELASVDFLASTPESEQVGYTPPPPRETERILLQPSRFDSFMPAMERWRERLDADAGNIAFFYYAGCVFRRPETLLAFADRGTISFPSFLDAMRGCRAARQLHIVDGIPLHVGTGAKTLKPRLFAKPTPRKSTGWGVIHGEADAIRSGVATDFSRALLQILDRPSERHWIYVNQIAKRLPRNLMRAPGRIFSAEVNPDFRFHYPGLGGRPPDPAEDETDTEFVPDDAEAERDALGRAVLAIGLARRLHKIWRHTNEPTATGVDGRAAFVVHIDAPWGGGKTSFANFLGRVLNPCPAGSEPAHFLRERYPGADLGSIFLDDPPPNDQAAGELAKLPADARRPWIVVPFNAWQAEHCTPPWWVFYQAIRKGCFDALRVEGDGAWTPRPPGARPRPRAVRSRMRWLYLALREYLWRLGDPRIWSVLIVAAIGSTLLLGLRWMGVDFDLASSLGILSGSLAGLWGVAAFFTESIAPGTGTVAERLSLGASDPFARFRIHFSRMMERIRRPVMVVVDDLDRCRPDFVVDLIRGIQTLLRSPRVVFVILGDRDWIERAFEAHHHAMREVDVGPEQSFGARFVEKAIQMSFILPALGGERQLGYVRRVLLGPRAEARQARAAPPIAAESVSRVREFVNLAAAAPGANPFDMAPILKKALKEVAELKNEAATGAALAIQVEQVVSETLAIRAATDKKVEQEVVHELQGLAPCFPANPRQIKRIVNAITIYYAVALQRPGLVPDDAFRAQLALWVIIMTEWPKTWRLLASFPELVDLLCEPDPRKAVRKPGLTLPGSAEATLGAFEPILADRNLMSLITGIDRAGKLSHAPLETRHARTLAELTPLHSRKRRLAEDAGNAPVPAARGKARAPAKGAAGGKRTPRSAQPRKPANTR